MVLVVIIVVMGLITAILTASLKRTSNDVTMAGNWKRQVRASEISETGLNLIARQVLDEYSNNGSIDALLGTIQFGTDSGGDYAVIIADNDNVGGVDQDGDGNSNTDVDGVFRLVASGALGATERLVEAFYRVQTGGGTGTPPSSEGIGAVGLCADNADVTRAGNISGEDYTPPADGCSGASCNGSLSGNPDNTGLSYNAGTSVSLSGGTPAGSPSENPAAAIDCAAWEAFLTAATAVATTTYNASDGPFNASSEASNFGDSGNPKIVRIIGTSGETVQFNGNLQGSGIVIVENAHVVFNGTFTFSGLVLIKDEGGGIQLGGRSNIFGSTMLLQSTGADGQLELDINSTKAGLSYSTEGLGRAADAFSNAGGGGGATLELLAWRMTEN